MISAAFAMSLTAWLGCLAAAQAPAADAGLIEALDTRTTDYFPKRPIELLNAGDYALLKKAVLEKDWDKAFKHYGVLMANPRLSQEASETALAMSRERQVNLAKLLRDGLAARYRNLAAPYAFEAQAADNIPEDSTDRLARARSQLMSDAGLAAFDAEAKQEFEQGNLREAAGLWKEALAVANLAGKEKPDFRKKIAVCDELGRCAPADYSVWVRRHGDYDVLCAQSPYDLPPRCFYRAGHLFLTKPLVLGDRAYAAVAREGQVLFWALKLTPDEVVLSHEQDLGDNRSPFEFEVAAASSRPLFELAHGDAGIEFPFGRWLHVFDGNGFLLERTALPTAKYVPAEDLSKDDVVKAARVLLDNVRGENDPQWPAVCRFLLDAHFDPIWYAMDAFNKDASASYPSWEHDLLALRRPNTPDWDNLVSSAMRDLISPKYAVSMRALAALYFDPDYIGAIPIDNSMLDIAELKDLLCRLRFGVFSSSLDYELLTAPFKYKADIILGRLLNERGYRRDFACD